MKLERYIAKTLFGLEDLLQNELNSLGAINSKIKNRAVYFKSDLKTLYRINLEARTALKILKPIINFRASTPNSLYKLVQDYDWSVILTSDETFSIDSVVNSRVFTHSKYAALKVKDAIVDQLREKTGKRPNIDQVNPTHRINLHIDDQSCTISLDTSGESLHRRGYRLEGEIAPLNEVLAAGMVMLSGWDQTNPFVDPMCGSGTLLIEAAMLANDIAPNLNRESFGFMKTKSFDRELFKSVKGELISKQKNKKVQIIGNDISHKVLISAKANVKRARLEHAVEFYNNDFFKHNNELNKGIIVTNPPYGERLRTDDINEFYTKIGDTLKREFKGFDAWILSSNKEALKKIGLRTSKRLQLMNGALECKFHKYELYEGSKKKKYERTQ